MEDDPPPAKRLCSEENSVVDEPDFAVGAPRSSQPVAIQADHLRAKNKIAKPKPVNELIHGDSKAISYNDVESIVEFIQSKTSIKPEIGIICGSGLGGLAEDLDEGKPCDVMSYKDIPNFPMTHVKGHKGNLVFGYLSGHPVVCMQGRFHFYEGHPSWKISMPIRVMKLLGVNTLVVTNAAGGLNENYKLGDIMIIKDHLNLVGMAGGNPLVGKNEDRFGPRFPSMSTAYDKTLRKLALETAQELKMSSFIREGVYVYLSGPSYETPAECRFLRLIGADSVGMSTVPEVVMAKHCGMKVLGFSLVTNMVIMDNDSNRPEPNHKEVMDTANMRAKDMQQLVKSVIDKYSKSLANSSSSPSAN